MVHFCVRPSFISSMVLVFLLFALSSCSPKVVEVEVICKQTKLPTFCSNLLNSIPGGASGADLVSLAQFTIEVARRNVTNTIKLIKSLIKESGGDPQAKEHYEECLLHYDYDDGALGEIEVAEQRLKSGDYFGLNIAASAIGTNIDDCISGESPPELDAAADPSLLEKYSDVVEQVVEILLIISSYLKEN